MIIKRKSLDTGNQQLTLAMSHMMKLSLPLNVMRFLAKLDKFLVNIRAEYDKLKKDKLKNMGGEINPQGIPQFPDEKIEEATRFQDEIIAYFEEEEDIDFTPIEVEIKEDYNITGNVVGGLEDFIIFTE
jgi:hypothetical protein